MGDGHSPFEAMLMAMVMLVTMVMECHSPFDLWELCTL